MLVAFETQKKWSFFALVLVTQLSKRQDFLITELPQNVHWGVSLAMEDEIKDRSTLSLYELKREMHPRENPLMGRSVFKAKDRVIGSTIASEYVDTGTGEIVTSTIVQKKQVDEEHFVKIFSAGIKEMYGLKRGALRLFMAIIEQYEQASMTGGYADTIYLSWFDGGLCGEDIGMSKRTFQNAFRELLAKNFLAPKSESVYWVNPALFFKGDRIRMVYEYNRPPRAVAGVLIEPEGDEHLQQALIPESDSQDEPE